MSTPALPRGCVQVYRINLRADIKTSVLLSLAAVVVGAATVVPALLTIPFNLYDTDNMVLLFVKPVVLVVSLVLYIVLRALLRTAFIRVLSGRSARCTRSGIRFFLGSDTYFDKKSYIILVLSPVVIIALILLVPSIVLPVSWFWVVYIIQVVNISGAVKDAYITYTVARLPADTLMRDTGVCITMYSALKDKEIK